MQLQKPYIRILNYLYDKFISIIDEKERAAYVRSIFLGISVFFIFSFSGIFSYSILNTNSQRQMLAVGLLLLAALFSMKDPLEPVRWNKKVIVPFLLGGIGLIITGLMHPIGDGYLNFGFMIILVYPCFFIVWNNRKDYETLFDILAWSNLTVSLIYLIYCLFVFSDDFAYFAENGIRFCGTTLNANYFSFVGMMMYCSAIYLAYRKRANKGRAAIFILLAAPGMLTAWAGASRAAIAAIILMTVAGLFFLAKGAGRWRLSRSKVIIVAIMVALTVAGCIIIHGASGKAEEGSTPVNSVIERFSPSGKDLNTYTSGRVDLWNIYIPMINWTGNDVDAIDWESLPVTQAAHCHNTFIEFGYRCGIIVAGLFLVLKLVSGVIALWYLFDPRKTHARYLFPVMVMIIYEICSLIDVATLPMERYAPFYFYLILAMLADAGRDRRTD